MFVKIVQIVSFVLKNPQKWLDGINVHFLDFGNFLAIFSAKWDIFQ